jgi:hypothetical protein
VVDPRFAWRGDIAIADGGELGPALGVVYFDKLAHLAESGLAWLPRRAARRAWRIPA